MADSQQITSLNSTTLSESHLTDVPDGFYDNEKARLKLLIGVQMARQRRRSLSRRLLLSCGTAAACAVMFFAGKSFFNLAPDRSVNDKVNTSHSLRAQMDPAQTASDQSYETYLSDDSEYSSSDMLMWLY
ncbi:MAG: hypothetical protein J6C44_09230 [Muribaculaceae bacterium]|nr:hypothetical protein [Muribaculaceae bacterium]